MAFRYNAFLSDAFLWELSGGEARRAMLARALLKGLRLLIADEPTADLDDRDRKSVV